MESVFSIVRAVVGYFFLVFIVRIVGRRPGKQLTPFEFILIFFLGGLMLTTIVADEASLVNAFCQIIAIASAHYALTLARSHSDLVAKVLDGTPLILMEGGEWRLETMRLMRMQDDDVMERARDQGLRTLEEIQTAVLERNGEISILPKKSS